MNLQRDDVQKSAQFAFDTAQTTCKGCAWYHGTWQYLRLFGIVASSLNEREFYLNAFESVCQNKKSIRVLISGSSDYAMLQLLHEFSVQADVRLHVSVLDICKTPLLLNEWYAQRENLDIETFCEDIIRFEPLNTFDLICTHSFFGNLERTLHTSLIKRWYALLAQGGHVVTVNRIRENCYTQQSFNAEQRKKFQETILAQTHRLKVKNDAFIDAIHEYTRRYVSHPIASEKEFCTLFTENGFRIKQFHLTGKNSMECAPSTQGEKRNAYIIASKI